MFAVALTPCEQFELLTARPEWIFAKYSVSSIHQRPVDVDGGANRK
jgi:hypothetical protein